MLQKKFYEFRKRCSKGVLINRKYRVTTDELMESINNIVVDLNEVKDDVWELFLEEIIIDNERKIYIEKI